MPTAFVDTTILTNIALKPGTDSCREAQQALAKHKPTLLPVYAIKEFKRGPLKNFVWLHNKLILTKSFAKTLAAIKGVMRQPYMVGTALEALERIQVAHGRRTLEELQKKHGASAALDSILCDQARLSLKTLVLKGWKRRRSITDQVVYPLLCYPEESPFTLASGLLDLTPKTCRFIDQCCLAEALKANPEALEKLANVLESQAKKPENVRRLKAIRTLLRKPRSPMSEKMCRDLGDAYFAFFAPKDAIILTTNLRDHSPLATALNKVAQQP